MALSPEAAEIVRKATIEALTRVQTVEDIVLEISRLCRSAESPAEFYDLGRLFAAVAEMEKRVTEKQRKLAGLDREPEPPGPAAPAAPAATGEPAADVHEAEAPALEVA